MYITGTNLQGLHFGQQGRYKCSTKWTSWEGA